MKGHLRTVARALPLLAVLALTPSCFETPLNGPPLGYETDELACADGRDNDRDGRVDCDDSDCLMGGFCGEVIPLIPPRGKETTVEECVDGIDNDDNGQFDCGDRKCQGIQELCCVAEFTNELCSDRLDNDGNGFADCADFACRNGIFVDVCDAESDCADDFDNDNDGDVDCDDEDCDDDRACGEETSCTDGVDNGGDGLTDCDDPECAGFRDCPPTPEDTIQRCGDGVDNDRNGFLDCNDFSCSMSEDPTVAAFCAEQQENTVEKCQDGVDNDSNGFTDCNDFSCSRSEDPDILAVCAASQENTLERCSDGVDNDSNGFIDCNDFSCSRSDDPDIMMLCDAQAENTLEKCSDGIDNDNNGYTDCDDNSCVLAIGELDFDDLESVDRWYALRRLCEADFHSCTDRTVIAEGPDPFYVLDDVWLCPGECREIDGEVRCGSVAIRDDEGDGYTNCADFSCRTAVSVEFDPESGLLVALSPCLESGFPPYIIDGVNTYVRDFAASNGISLDPAFTIQSIAQAQCSDGIDNDCDGFVDAEDWDCNWNPITTEMIRGARGGGALVCE